MKIHIVADKNDEKTEAIKEYANYHFPKCEITISKYYYDCDLLFFHDLTCYEHNKHFLPKQCPPYIIVDISFVVMKEKNSADRRVLNRSDSPPPKKVHYFSLSWGGINGLGRYYNDECKWRPLTTTDFSIVDRDRFKERGKDILILGQSPYDIFLISNNVNYQDWLTKICDDIKQQTNRKIYFRQHPKASDITATPDYVKRLNEYEPLQKHLKQAWATVAYSSSAGIYSLMEGVPHFAESNMSACWSVCNSIEKDIGNIDNIGNLDYDSIYQFGAKITNRCYKLKEISKGHPKNLMKHYRKELRRSGISKP